MRFRDLPLLSEQDLDLGHAALLLAAEIDPAVDPEGSVQLLDRWGEEAQIRLRGIEGAFDRLEVLMDFLYREKGLSGDLEDYYNPQNSLLHSVLERRKGIPISLAVIVIEVGRRVDIPLVGVNFPGHFLIRHALHQGIVLDPFQAGRVLTEEECKALLVSFFGSDAVLRPEMLYPVGSHEILLRMLNNLRGSYLRNGEIEQAIDVIENILLFEPDELWHRRDLGVLRIYEGDERGIDDLSHYLAEEPEAPNRQELEALLAEARDGLTIH